MQNFILEHEKSLPQVVFEWRDTETDAIGWLVIDSMRGGAAGGGTRMHENVDMNEIKSLAKIMSIKFAAIEFPIGGAKSGIKFDPSDPRKYGVLKRWYQAIQPILKNYYGTGGDLNVDEINEVIPITHKLGVFHPQEGILRGHFNLGHLEHKKRIIQLQKGVSKLVNNRQYAPNVNNQYTIADLITGYGVSESVKHYYSIYGGELRNKKVIIQGWGNVGSSAGYYLSKAGAKIVGIIDQFGCVINEDGFSFDEISELFVNCRCISLKNVNKFIPFKDAHNQIWDIDVDIFIPAAGSRMVSQHIVDRMMNRGLKLISSGANIPFQDIEVFYGSICKYVDENISLIPDFVSNCGMARFFAYLMQKEVSLDETLIFEDVSGTIKTMLNRAFANNKSKNGITKTFLNLYGE